MSRSSPDWRSRTGKRQGRLEDWKGQYKTPTGRVLERTEQRSVVCGSTGEPQALTSGETTACNAGITLGMKFLQFHFHQVYPDENTHSKESDSCCIINRKVVQLELC